jgi:hypothetical protein
MSDDEEREIRRAIRKIESAVRALKSEDDPPSSVLRDLEGARRYLRRLI